MEDGGGGDERAGLTRMVVEEMKGSEGLEEKRGRFLVSAVTTTTTLSTATLCYTAGTLTAPCR